MKNNQLNPIIYFFGLLKLLIHFFTNTNYSFHRDEYLYLDQGNHLGLGFMEIPPLLPVISKIIGWLGSSVFITRLFPALVGMATIILAGMIVKNLGGKNGRLCLLVADYFYHLRCSEVILCFNLFPSINSSGFCQRIFYCKRSKRSNLNFGIY